MKNPSSYFIHAAFIALSSLLGVTCFLLFADVIGRSLQSVLHLEVSPSFTGGKVAAVIFDPSGDDHGSGSLTLPEGMAHLDGSLDLVRYTVHQPVRKARLSPTRSYWQLDLAFREPSENAPVIKIYLGADGLAGGSTQTAKEFAEGVEFDPASPWQFVISVQNGSGTIRSWDGLVSLPLDVQRSKSKREVSIRVPLEHPELSFLQTIAETRQYVCIGLWQADGRDGFADVGESEFCPKLFDILVSEGLSQEAMLSAWSEDDLTSAVLYPVTVPMRVASASRRDGPDPETYARFEELKKKAEVESAAEAAAALALYESAPADPLERALAAFNAGKNAESESLFDELLSRTPASSFALAYKGSLVAMRAGDAQPLAAVGMVNEAYAYLDRAVTLAATPAERIDAYLNRANVSMAVPDSVFGKARSGGDDFLTAADYEKKGLPAGEDGKKALTEKLATMYTKAARCYELSGDTSEAETWFREARVLLETVDPDRCAEARLEVFRHFEMTEVAAKPVPGGKAAKKAALKKARATLALLLVELKASPSDVSLVARVLKIQVMELEAVKDALDIGEQYRSILEDSVEGQIYLAVAECKMAKESRKTVDKVEWVTLGMNHFDDIQAQWPDNEDVFIYQAMTYSNFPAEMGMRETVQDLLVGMSQYYAAGTWTLSDNRADLLWQTIANLEENYPDPTERSEIRKIAELLKTELPLIAERPMALEASRE